MNKEVNEIKDRIKNRQEYFNPVYLAIKSEEINILLDYINQLETNNFKLQARSDRYKQKVNQLETNWNYLKNWLKANDIHYAEAIPFRETLNKMQELERGNE